MLDLSNEYLRITILAAVQGLTEFLPVSSSGHLVLVPKLLGFADPGLAVDAFLHLGTMFAALIYFREDILLMWKAMFLSLQTFCHCEPKQSPKQRRGIASSLSETRNDIYQKLAIGIMLASIPAIFIGFNYKEFFESEMIRSTSGIAYTLIAGSILMLISEMFFAGEKNISALGKKGMFFIGCMQSLALFPGVSRSGSTISGGLFLGLKKEEAARFSFLLGLPVIAGAGALAIKDLLETGLGTDINLWILVTGLVVSFVSGYLAIDFLLKFLKKQSLLWFVVYRLLLALYLIYFF